MAALEKTPTPLLELDLRRLSFRTAETKLENIRLSLHAGECLVLTGASGCGKTSLLRLISGLIPSFYPAEAELSVRLHGRDIRELEKGEIAKYLGFVFQNPQDQFFSSLSEDEVALVGENLGLPAVELRARVYQAFQQVGISSLREKSVFELSGGERQKVAIGSTLVPESEILLLDEPSASLDYRSTLRLADTLAALKAQGKCLVIAEHRLFYLRELIDRLAIIQDKHIVGIYQSKDLSEALRKQYQLRCFTENDLVSELSIRPDSPPTVSSPEAPAVQVPNSKPHSNSSCVTNSTPLSPPNDKIKSGVQIRRLSLQRGKQELARGLSFDIDCGECLGLVGSNGIGKTTLAKELAGLLPLKQGQLSYGRSGRARRQGAYLLMQDASTQLFADSVERELLSAVSSRSDAQLARIRHALQSLDLWDKRQQSPQALSGGEQQRLALILALLAERKLIILDEPSAGLDYKRMAQMAKLISERSQDVPMLLITHDSELLFKVCRNVLLLRREGCEKIPLAGNEARILDFMRQG